MRDASAVVGGEIEAWCTRCKLDLNHTIVAMLDGRVKRVQCLTCAGQHNYAKRARPAAGDEVSVRAQVAGSKPAPKRRSKANVVVDDGRLARPYSFTDSFQVGEYIAHPGLGRGRVVRVRGDKVDVEFGEVPKTLVHGRRATG